MIESVRRGIEMDVEEILRKLRTVAIVGLSKDPVKDSYRVAGYLKSKGYRIIPINPTAEEILGERCYKTLLSMPEEVQRAVDVVNIFRKSEDTLQPVSDAVMLKERFGNLKVVWMQLGVVNEEAAEKAREAGLTVIMDRCIMVEHKRIF
jgi:predicted CoA-binding protein